MVKAETHKEGRPPGSRKQQNLTKLVLLISILVSVNILSGFVFTRFDLTSDKRFTLDPSTIKVVSSLKDVVYVRVYLEGDFPPAFKRLQNATREMLDELRAYSNGNLEYEFINPSANPDDAERKKIYQQLAAQGIQPTNLTARNKEGTSEQVVFPGAMITYLSQEMPVMLLQDQSGVGTEQMLNNSIQSMEYNIMNAIRKVTNLLPQRVAFIEGHGEWEENQVADITRELKTSYLVERVKIDEKLGALKGIHAVIIAGSDSLWSEKDKFILDQYIMNGGKVLWLLDGTTATMDSLQYAPETIALANDVNLEDMLFRYGVRVNYNLLMDLQSAPIPVVTGVVGNRPQQSLLPWYYFPVIVPSSTHPLVKNLNALKFEFVSSLDTVGNAGIKKTVLLSTSKYSREMNAPVRVDLDIMRREPDVNDFNKSELPVAVLLEGAFVSNYRNRVSPLISQDSAIGFRSQGDTTRMIVIGDADVIRNNVRKSDGAIAPLGLDRYTGTVYGNKALIMNCVDYLFDDSGLMNVRAKEFKLLLLDKTRLDTELLKWQLINTIVPVLLVLIFAVIKFIMRKRKYAI
ncbi:MAG TPA: gliding motility-associated ABC transporter substrate-binding protein GldG [Bacteroidia bacterium]|nr:gliding motility-associated ABC transporter substrate-binding protein GldG [Bacteroidia bacterium]